MINEIKISPCPFCGYENPRVVFKNAYGIRAYVMCGRCHARGSLCKGRSYEGAEELAIAHWNYSATVENEPK